jgi:hypothetical protein
MATLATLIVDVRSDTDHDSDTQVSDAQITVWANRQYYLLRQKLADVCPTLYNVQLSFTVAAGASSYTITPAGGAETFLKVRKLERQDTTQNSYWNEVGVANPLDPEAIPDGLDWAFLERSGVLDIYPSLSAPGTYRLTYIGAPAALTGSATIALPTVLEETLVQRIAARVRIRLREDPGPHLALAAESEKEAWAWLAKRYGIHPQGLIQERRNS